MLRILRTFLLSVLLVPVAAASPANGSQGFSLSSVVPSRYSDFRTITTKHFNIHYPTYSSEPFFMGKNMEMIARLAAVYLEEGFEKLTQDLNSKPFLRIQVVIVDNTDSHNGFATPVPQNTIYIYAIPPLSYTSIAEYDNWLRDTAFHELTHIISLSTTRGYSAMLRAMFGTIVSINGLSPLNVIEGYTVYEETNMTKKGRGRSTYLHTMMRTTAYENTLNTDELFSLSRAPYMIDRWPLGNVPYLYGYLLMEHVAKKYGRDLPGKISKHNAGVVPYYPSYSFKKFTGMDIPHLWDQMLEEKRQYYSKWIDHISRGGITEVQRIGTVSTDFIHRLPSLSPDGKYLAYAVTDPNRSNRIAIIDTASNEEIDHIKADNPTFIKWLNNNTVIYNRENSAVGSYYYGAAMMNVETDEHHGIQNSTRLLYAGVMGADASGDLEGRANILCTIRAKTGMMDINIERLSGTRLETIKTVYESKYLSRISTPVCVADNSGHSSTLFHVYFIEKELDGKEQIVRVDSSGIKTILHQTEGSIKDIRVADGKLYFIDDPDHVFNVYSMDLGKGAKRPAGPQRMTNLMSGAFDLELAPMAKGKELYITYYTSKGFRIGKVAAAETSSASFTVDNLAVTDEPRKFLPQMDRKLYTGFKSLIPKLWMPSFMFVDGGYIAGGMTYGADSLFRHQYFASAAYDSRTESGLFGVVYTNQSFYPTYSVSLYNDNTWYSDTEIIKDTYASVDMAVPFNTELYLLTGITYDYRMLDFIDRRTRRFGVYAGIGYNDTSTTMSAISVPEEGVSGYLTYTLFPKGMSTYNEYVIDGVARFYIPMWWNGHVIAINNNVSYSYGNPYMFFVAGGEQSALIFGTKKYLLRGYPVSYFGTRSLIISNIEYRFPIVTIHSGHDLFPLFIKKLHGAFITDHGFIGKNFKNDYHSFGFELRADAQILYHMPVTLRIGLYKGTGYPKGQFFIGVSSVF